MFSALCYFSVYHYIYSICFYHIYKTVRYENNSLALCQILYLIHDVVFTLNINIRSSFIKNIYRTIVEKSPCKRKPLTLTAGQIGRFF